MAGSASKSSEKGSRSRSFNIYDILYDNTKGEQESGYEVLIRRYSWDHSKENADGSKGDFGDYPLEQRAFFPSNRGNDI